MPHWKQIGKIGKKGTSHIVSNWAELLRLELENVERCPQPPYKRKELPREIHGCIVVVSLGFYHDDADEIKIPFVLGNRGELHFSYWGYLKI